MIEAEGDGYHCKTSTELPDKKHYSLASISEQPDEHTNTPQNITLDQTLTTEETVVPDAKQAQNIREEPKSALRTIKPLLKKTVSFGIDETFVKSFRTLKTIGTSRSRFGRSSKL